MIFVEKTTMFVLVVVLASVCLTTTTVSAACTERPADGNNATDSAVDKVSNFFVEVGCTIKSGAERVKERVESGYNYLKSKITPEDMKNQTMTDGEKADGDRITFKEDDESMGGSVQAVTPAGIRNDKNMPQKVEIADRTALSAPEFCAEGQVLINAKCRQIAEI